MYGGFEITKFKDSKSNGQQIACLNKTLSANPGKVSSFYWPKQSFLRNINSVPRDSVNFLATDMPSTPVPVPTSANEKSAPKTGIILLLIRFAASSKTSSVSGAV
jgi:hypothetical protein